MNNFVVCIDNREYPASLETRKIYELLPDPVAIKRDYVRIIDESGEDYLYPSQLFIELPLTQDVAEKVAKIA